ncbi:MAG: hypothetical protein ACOCV3_02410 [Halanaerobiales bacterium]
MKSKYSILIILLIFIFGGLGIGLLTIYFPFEFINDFLFQKEFSINPSVEIQRTDTYKLEIWYPPFYRTLPALEEEFEFEKLINDCVKKEYPNFQIITREISFSKIQEKLNNSFKKGNPPALYINFGPDDQLSKNYQIPVERYINKSERKKYIVDWNQYDKKNLHLWCWPLVWQEQIWITNSRREDMKIAKKIEQLPSLEDMGDLKLNINFHDQLFLRQLLTIKGVKGRDLENEQLSKKFKQDLIGILYWLDLIKNEGRLNNKNESIIDNFLNQNKQLIAGGNIWLDNYLENSDSTNSYIRLDSIIKIYGINVFIPGDDRNSKRIKAHMEVARLISENLSNELADILSLNPAYDTTGSNTEQKTKNQLMEVNFSEQKFWQEKVWPCWIAYGENELSLNEVMEKLFKE